MKYTKLDQIRDNYNLKGIGDILVDQIDSYPITIKHFKTRGIESISIIIPFTNVLYLRYGTRLKEELKEKGIKNIKHRKEFLIIPFKIRDDVVVKYGLLKQVITPILIDKINYLSCAYCQKTGSNILALKDTVYIGAHSSCHEKQLKSIEQIDTNASWRSYIKGGLGAFLGAILPMIIALLFISITEYSYGWLYIASPISAVIGYDKMKVAKGYKALLVTVISCFLAFLIFIHATVICAAQVQGVLGAVSVSELFQLTNTLIFSTDFFSEFWFELLFFLIGLISMLISNPFSKNKMLRQKTDVKNLTYTIVNNRV